MRIEKSFGKFCLAKQIKIDSQSMGWISALPGYKKWQGRDLLFSPTGANVQHIQDHCPDARWLGESAQILQDYLDSQREADQNRADKNKILEASDFAFKTAPFDHQQQAFLLSRDKKNFALLMEQGTGKTKVIIDTAAYLYANGKIDTLVVIAPNGVHRNWLTREVPAHLPDWCPYASEYYYSGMRKAHKQKFETAMYAKDCLKILTFNVECFVSKVAIDYMNKILLANHAMLVVDESSRIKRPSAKRTKMITKFSTMARYKRIMTGTPVTRGAEDVYSQFKFLDPNILGYDSFYSFKSQYCVMGGWENKQIVSYRKLNELTKSIEGHSYRVLKKDCLDLPKKIYQRYPIELTKKQREIYDTLKKEFVTELEGERMTAPEAITRLLRLQQIICGWFPTEDKILPIEGKNPRLEALNQILSEIDSKVIIWARFKADLKAIEASLNDKAVSYHGDVSSEAREDAVERFQNDPKIQYFIGQPQSGGIGLTLTAAEYAIYYSNSFDLETRRQSEDRCHRIGTPTNVTYIDIEASKTIDSKIIKSLRTKKSLADVVNADPMSIFLEEDSE